MSLTSLQLCTLVGTIGPIAMIGSIYCYIVIRSKLNQISDKLDLILKKLD